MKKLTAISIALLMIFLSACSGNPSADTASDAEISSVQASRYNTITDWGTDLLPEKFPSPPKGTHDFSVVQGEGTDASFAYSTNFVRITFICSENEFHSFIDEMTALGYKGGAKNIENGTFYTSKFHGYWQDGTKMVIINNTTKTDNGEYIFEIDIADCADNFPEELEKFFPKFEGYCKSTGSFCGHDGNGDQVTDVFEGSFALPGWHWEFRFSNGFIGVDQVDFERYFYDIESAGCQASLTTHTVDGCTVMCGDLIKRSTEGDYGVFMVYNLNLKTLDIAYTNDASIYTDQVQSHE